MNLSVVIATMDRPSALERALASLARSQVPAHEVVVVDCSHGPETRVLVEERAEHWPGLRRLALPGAGSSRGRNHGAKVASGDLILITDDDCLVHEDCIGQVVRSFEADAELSCLTGRVLPYGDVQGKVAVAINSSVERRTWRGKTRPWGMGHSSNMTFRREVYRAIGGFDEEMGPGTHLYAAEDLDVLYRVLQLGGTVTYEPDAVIYHDQWRSRAQARRRRADYARGTAAFLLKHLLVHRDRYALRMLAARLWLDVPYLALNGLRKRNLELELVSLYQGWGLLTGLVTAARHYRRRRPSLDAPAEARA